jgi:hypothetical protein
MSSWTTPTLTNSGTLFNNANGTITVTLPNTSSLSVNTAALTANTPANLVNITVISGGMGGATKLSQLTDVVTAGEEDGDVLIYNQSANNYVIEPFNLDSGEF